MPPSLEPEVRIELLRLSLRQARQASIGAYIAAPILTLYLESQLAGHLVVMWLLLMFAVLTLRNRHLARVTRNLDRLPESVPFRTLQLSSIALAAVIAALPIWALPLLDFSHALLLTTVCALWVSAALFGLALLPSSFYAYAGTSCVGLCLGWLRSDHPHVAPVTSLIVVYLGVLFVFGRNFSRVVTSSVRIRLDNQRLVRQLQLANEAKSRMLLTASHDLRQPLHALSLFSSALNADPTPEQQKLAARGIRESVNGLVRLLTALLDVAKLDAQAVTPKRQPLALADLFTRLSQEYHELCRAKGLAWECSFQPLTVQTDPQLLERLLRNLLDNALKHGARGPIGLKLSRDKSVTIEIYDHGTGISENERAHVFEEFYRLSPSAASSGLGLGLSIVQRIVRMLDYTIRIDYTQTDRRLGTRFVLTIPEKHLRAEASARPQAPEHFPASKPTLDGLQVLVIEDDPGVMAATMQLLRQWGCTVLGGSDLQSLLAQKDAEHLEPAVALIDNARNGESQGTHAQVHALRVATEVSARWPDAGIVLVSGETDPEVLRHFKQSGYPMLEKPVDPGELRDVLEMFHQLR